MEEKLKEIRNRLRLAMNGVIATSMREKGMKYKLNFGVPYPEIKQIAASFEPDAELATALWKEDIREFKILAGMLQPVDSFSFEEAEKWVSEISYGEIAEQCSKNLFAKLPYADDLAIGLVFKPQLLFARTVAFLIWMYWFADGKELSAPWKAGFLVESTRSLSVEVASWMEKQAALKALKAYGRQSAKQSGEVLGWLKEFPVSGTPEQQEFYNDLKFEFDYCR